MTKKSIRILIYIDQVMRDCFGMKLIGSALAESGDNIQVHYCCALNAKQSFNRFRPDIVLMGNVDCYHGDYAREFHEKGALIFSLPTEQMLASDELKHKRIELGHDVAKSGKFRLPALEITSRMYFWGKDYVDYLIKRNPALYKERVCFSGCPRLTHIHKGLRPVKNPERITVGIALDETFGFQNNMEFFFTSLDHFSENDLEPTIEGQIALIYYLSGKMLRLIRVLAKMDDIKIIVRPRFPLHPGEFEFLERAFPHIEIDKNTSHKDLLEKSDLFISGFSSISSEALIAGIPSISTMTFWETGVREFTSYMHDTPPYNLCWPIHEFAEIRKYIDLRKSGELELSPNMPKLNDFVRSYYINPDFEGHPSKVIAKDIIETYKAKISAPVEKETASIFDLIIFFMKNAKIVYHMTRKKWLRNRYYFSFFGN